LPPPLGVKGTNNARHRIQRIIMSTDIPLHYACNAKRRLCLSVNFMETLHALAGIVAGAELPAEQEQQLHSYFKDSMPKEAGPKGFSAAHAYAAMTVTAAMRGFLQRQRIVDEVLKGGDLSLLENGYLPFRAQSSALISRTSSRAPSSRKLVESRE
ncbi:hypothetical protein DUNSADRAFT_4066, partial [Dunaliella salina]